MEYVLWYLLLAIPCFLIAYCNGLNLNMRLPHIRDGFRLLVHDYLETYCPWSWKRARKHRLADMRIYLGVNGRCHDRLGHITTADCDDPEKQEAIARHTYMSRTRFWTNGVLHFLVAPILVLFIISCGHGGLARH